MLLFHPVDTMISYPMNMNAVNVSLDFEIRRVKSKLSSAALPKDDKSNTAAARFL